MERVIGSDGVGIRGMVWLTGSDSICSAGDPCSRSEAVNGQYGVPRGRTISSKCYNILGGVAKLVCEAAVHGFTANSPGSLAGTGRTWIHGRGGELFSILGPACRVDLSDCRFRGFREGRFWSGMAGAPGYPLLADTGRLPSGAMLDSVLTPLQVDAGPRYGYYDRRESTPYCATASSKRSL